MKKFKSLISILLFIFIFSTTLTSANMNYKEITALIKNVTIQNNSSLKDSEVLFYQDHIYVPLRLAAETLKASVKWNAEEQMVELTVQNNFVDFPEANPLNDERFVYGEIVDIDKNNYTVTIEQHIDDNSVYQEPTISVERDVILVLQRNDKKININFDDLYFGEYIGIVLNSAGRARGIILNS